VTEAVSLAVLPAGPVLAADLPAQRAGVVRVAWCPEDIVDEWGADSFPASDPPANW
jgi:hypothetical protein